MSIGLIVLIIFQIQGKFAIQSSSAIVQNQPPRGEAENSQDLIVSTPSTDDLDQIASRPLFSKSRRPVSPAVEEISKTFDAAPRPLSLELAGTMLTGAARMVLLKHSTKGLLRLQQGQDIDGWRIEEIGLGEVRLRQGEQETWLRLRKNFPNSGSKSRPKAQGQRDQEAGKFEPASTSESTQK